MLSCSILKRTCLNYVCSGRGDPHKDDRVREAAWIITLYSKNKKEMWTWEREAYKLENFAEIR